jgi:hypothetical protein
MPGLCAGFLPLFSRKLFGAGFECPLLDGALPQLWLSLFSRALISAFSARSSTVSACTILNGIDLKKIPSNYTFLNLMI